MKILKSLFFYISLAIFFASCEQALVLKEAPYENEVELNKPFVVILPENHDTGYTWFLKNDFDNNLNEHVSTVWHGNEKGVYFNFKALKLGETKLNFISIKYRDTSDFKQFTIKSISK